MAKEKSARFSIKGLGLGVGICWGLSMLVVGWLAMLGWGGAFLSVMASFYIGFEPTFIGSIIGGIWGFFCGFICGAVIAYFYNMFRK